MKTAQSVQKRRLDAGEARIPNVTTKSDKVLEEPSRHGGQGLHKEC